MKKSFLLLGLICFFSFCSAQSPEQQKLEELLSAYSKQELFNGSVLVANKGTILINKGFGLQDISHAIPNSSETQFQIGSVTKQFTTAIVLKLQEEGKLSVTDRVNKYFPDFPNGNKISITQLMQHSSGIYNYTNDQDFMEKEVTKAHSREQIMALFKDKDLEFEPGTKWNYSNSAYCLLGYIVENVTGKTYEQVVRSYIFKPLGMNASGFDFTHLSGSNKATGYLTWQGKQSALAPIVDSTVSFSAGSIYSTVTDLNKWANAVLKQAVIKPASWYNAFTPGLNKYGYGWFVDTLNKKKFITHGGGIHGFNSNLFLVPEDQTIIILLSNVNSSILNEINSAIVAVLNNQPYKIPAANQEIKINALALQQYVGDYELAPTFKITVSTEDGRLFGQATNQSKFEMYAEKEDYFFLKVVKAEVEFIKNAEGKITKLILHQNGQHLAGIKIN